MDRLCAQRYYGFSSRSYYCFGYFTYYKFILGVHPSKV